MNLICVRHAEMPRENLLISNDNIQHNSISRSRLILSAHFIHAIQKPINSIYVGYQSGLYNQRYFFRFNAIFDNE